jgi:hypothetical protein
MRKYFLLILLLVLVGPAQAAPAPQSFLVLYSNDVQGETEPCG